MISRHIGIQPKSDNYGNLAEYIAAGYESEKCLMAWCSGCLDNDDYADSIEEVRDTQVSYTKSGKNKTYHLLISFRPEDEAKLTPEIFKAIEEKFALALGFSEHQRHCGVHGNTNNVHLHIAYNMIHPERLTRHEPFRDYLTRDRLCRELEKEYGLTVDNGRDTSQQKHRLQATAATVEARTGQESFESYAVRHKSEIMGALAGATSWQELHEAFARFGMEIRPHGNGLSIKDRHGKHAAKASAVDRSFSLKKLENRFGPYIPPASLDHVQEQERYQAVPFQHSPERGELFARYMAGIEERKQRLEAAKQQEAAAIAAIKQRWADERKRIERMSIAKKNRRNLLALARKHEMEALAKARLESQPARSAVRRDIPFTSWNAFLQHEADNGSELALAILRSGKEKAEPETPTLQPEKDWSRHGQEYTDQAAIRAEFSEKHCALLEREDLTAKGKKRLQDVLNMEQILAEAKAKGLPVPRMTHHIDGRVTIIFSLEGGGGIRDSGKEILFSPHAPAAREFALLYGKKKWGQRIRVENGRITMQPERQLARPTPKPEKSREHDGISR